MREVGYGCGRLGMGVGEGMGVCGWVRVWVWEVALPYVYVHEDNIPIESLLEHC